MKRARIIALIAGVGFVVIYTAFVIISYPGVFFVYNIVRALPVDLFFGVIIYFVVLGIGALIYQIFKPRKERIK
jgi:hypothetical protein